MKKVMKDLKETLDALSRHGRGWWQRLWMPYGVLAVLTGAFVALLVMSCVSTFLPLIEWWKLTGDWTAAMEMTQPDVLWTTVTALSFISLFGASWYAHRAMTRVVGGYAAKELRGRRRGLLVLTAAVVMMVVALVMWMPVVVLLLSADATAVSEVWDNAVVTPAWVWISAFCEATMAMFVCEWTVTLCRLMFKKM